ncbi:site-specific integrase [Actinopolymorpha pittospori]
MARPRLPVGTAGQVRVYATSNGWRATCKVRDYDGQVRDVERRASTKAKAKIRLAEAVRDRVRPFDDAELTGETYVHDLAELWFAEVRELDRSPTTMEQYRYSLDSRILPALGGLRLREVSVSRIDQTVKVIRAKHGNASARMVRSILSGMFGLAVRHDAMVTNPARDIARIESGEKAARSLTIAEARDLRVKIATSEKAVDWDLPDFTDMMLATGFRIGETSAITWDALDLDEGTVKLRGTVIRLKGQGLILKLRPKRRGSERTLELPSWAVDMLRARRERRASWALKVNVLQDGEITVREVEPVFTAPMGGLRDPSNTQADLREVFDAAGYDWVSSHVFRKTVGTLMDAAGLSARAAADQLGHKRVSMTQDRYMGRGVVRTGAKDVLERLVHGDRAL